jgi:hypothetical protein
VAETVLDETKKVVSFISHVMDVFAVNSIPTQFQDFTMNMGFETSKSCASCQLKNLTRIVPFRVANLSLLFLLLLLLCRVHLVDNFSQLF